VLDQRRLSRLCYSGGLEIVAAEEKGSWQPHWIGLLSHLRDTVPPAVAVIVMSDRGLYAPWLDQHIVSLGWHPFRINKQGNFAAG